MYESSKRDFFEPDNEFAYRRECVLALRGKIFRRAVFGYSTTEDRENHLKEEARVLGGIR